MGALLSRCGICDQSDSKFELINKISILRQQIVTMYSKNVELQKNHDVLYKQNQTLLKHVNHTSNILGNSNKIADAILQSELNCKWMDDNQERDYIIGIIDLLDSVCSDVSCLVASRTNNKPGINKIDSTDNSYNDSTYADGELLGVDTLVNYEGSSVDSNK